MKSIKVVIIGAGSRCFGRGQVADFIQANELADFKVELCLVDENKASLEIMTQFANRVRQHFKSQIVVRSTTDRRTVLEGADYVITSVARRRYELWEQDFRVPLSYGFRHCLGENGGPAAMFHALRSFELIIPICRDIEELCPNALLLNFTNPEARVLHAICHLTSVRAVGLCHGIVNILNLIKSSMNRPLNELKVISSGMNHFYHVSHVIDKLNGKDIIDEVVEKCRKNDMVQDKKLFQKMLSIFGLFGYFSDDHIGEYLSYGSEYSGVKWPYGIECKKLGGKTENSQVKLDEYALGQTPLDEHILRRSEEMAVPIICDIELDRKEFRPSVNVVNSKPYIDNLSRTAVVEVPAIVDKNGVHPESVGPLPEPIAAIIRTHHTIHELLTEAYKTRSKKLLLQALLLDPVVNSISAAEKMLDEMLDLQSEFLPKFH